ncbi:hypothetical protein [Brachybacterium vulturis]|uniref:hypothetical protein n=1 Tax=Brachybacterium vulturis TaxID=2017484 RepID=UPI0037364A3B
MNTNPQPDALRSRWTLEGRVPLSGVADGAVWHRARSISTGEGVVLFVVRGEAALEAADAVRRAYLVEDPHLLAVKDIVVFDDPRDTRPDPPASGSADGPTTVVEYSLPPAPPLAALLAEGPLHPETARAIIGEAATGLEAARRRGVRHQFLDSNRVFVDTRSGAVVLLGIGVEAAAHPGLDRSREVASFQDTAALVALLYRALTGRSPRHDATGIVPRPSTLVDTTITEDLDLLCDLVLNESADEIPETTRELIEALQPWQSIPVTLEAYSRSAEPAPEAESTSDDELESTALMAAVQDEESAPDQDTAQDQETAPDRTDEVQPDSAAAKALVEDLHLDQKRSTSPFPGHLEITAPPEPTTEGAPTTGRGAQAAGGAAVGAAAAGTATGAAASWEVADRTPDLPSRTAGSQWPLVGTDAGDAPLAPASPTQGVPDRVPQNVGQASTPAATTPGGSAATPSSPVAHSADAAATTPVPVTGRTDQVAPERGDGPIVIHGRDRSVLEEPEQSTVPFQRSSLLRDVVGVAVNTDAPETYAMGPRDQEKRSLQSQWIIIGGAIVVMIALVFALTTITSDIRDILADPLATSPAATTAAPTEEETGEAPAEPTEEVTEEALPAPQIDGVELLALPDGEEPDHTDQQERLTDGDTSTYWSTQHYASPDYGGLKEGVGIRLHFAEPSTFTAVTVTTALNNGGAIELHAVNEDGSPGEVLATGEFVADGEVRLEAPETMETDTVMLWIPDLPPDSSEDGRFRARIAEIQVE